MSVVVQTWVFQHSQETLGNRLVLLVLADHAKEDGTAAWPSVATIARMARLSERQVQRCLHDMKSRGSIRAVGESKSGTIIYDVNMIVGGDNMSEGGVTSATKGGDDMSPDPLVKQPSVVLAPAARERKPNPIWDSLAVIFGEPTTRTSQTLRGKIVSSLTAARASPDEIMRRAKTWPQHFDGATLTETALEKHWDTLGRPPLRSQR